MNKMKYQEYSNNSIISKLQILVLIIANGFMAYGFIYLSSQWSSSDFSQKKVVYLLLSLIDSSYLSF